MANGIRTGDPREFNKGRRSKFRVGSRVRQTPEEDRRTYLPKLCENNNKDEDNCRKPLMIKIIKLHLKNSDREFNMFEFRVFLLDWLYNQSQRNSLIYYLPRAGGRIIRCIAFPRVLALCEMQIDPSKIWTDASVSITYDDNHYCRVNLFEYVTRKQTEDGRLAAYCSGKLNWGPAHIWQLNTIKKTHLFSCGDSGRSAPRFKLQDVDAPTPGVKQKIVVSKDRPTWGFVFCCFLFFLNGADLLVVSFELKQSTESIPRVV